MSATHHRGLPILLNKTFSITDKPPSMSMTWTHIRLTKMTAYSRKHEMGMAFRRYKEDLLKGLQPNMPHRSETPDCRKQTLNNSKAPRYSHSPAIIASDQEVFHSWHGAKWTTSRGYAAISKAKSWFTLARELSVCDFE